jgi:hypothetical protein
MHKEPAGTVCNEFDSDDVMQTPLAGDVYTTLEGLLSINPEFRPLQVSVPGPAQIYDG